jgi:hypothetical protein
VLLLITTAILSLLVASPALQRLLVYPQTEFFTEMWLLDSGHEAVNFPSMIASNVNYQVFMGLRNQLGSCAYYSIQVKFRNQDQPAADSFDHTPSSLPALHSIAAVVPDKEIWESPLTFSFAYTHSEDPVNANFSKVNVNTLVLNGAPLNLDGFSATWDPEKNGFFVYLFFELWLYNDEVGSFQYHERYTSLRLNMTV